ncbi:hypothetical protein [Foetidibacter luteolus]|uniref:hypothetical protein n=1 Tax=Foetidibacter luteolus TaxID=2608880 RepID=UPI00129BD671|nr:hypothetical protein [Foetidibacter luteolus]
MLVKLISENKNFLLIFRILFWSDCSKISGGIFWSPAGGISMMHRCVALLYDLFAMQHYPQDKFACSMFFCSKFNVGGSGITMCRGIVQPLRGWEFCYQMPTPDFIRGYSHLALRAIA